MTNRRFSHIASWTDWTRTWNRNVINSINDLEAPPGPIYEFGCYPGKLIRNLRRKHLHQREVFGFDTIECNIRNTVVCDVFNIPEEYDKPIAIAINDLWVKEKKEIFPWIYERLLPGGLYIHSLKGPDYIIPEHLSDLQKLDSTRPWLYIGRKKTYK